MPWTLFSFFFLFFHLREVIFLHIYLARCRDLERQCQRNILASTSADGGRSITACKLCRCCWQLFLWTRFRSHDFYQWNWVQKFHRTVLTMFLSSSDSCSTFENKLQLIVYFALKYEPILWALLFCLHCCHAPVRNAVSALEISSHVPYFFIKKNFFLYSEARKRSSRVRNINLSKMLENLMKGDEIKFSSWNISFNIILNPYRWHSHNGLIIKWSTTN